jgi:hypothetical protein
VPIELSGQRNARDAAEEHLKDDAAGAGIQIGMRGGYVASGTFS